MPNKVNFLLAFITLPALMSERRDFLSSPCPQCLERPRPLQSRIEGEWAVSKSVPVCVGLWLI